MTHPDARADDRGDSELEHEVMARCVEAWNTGGAAAADAVLAQHPALAPRLRERLAKLERAGLLGADDGPSEIPERLGEFKLLRRLGSGGMGVVFLAEQESLGRTVALKLVRPEQRFFPGARARFRREVEAIARLGDPGIVPIYSVGQDQGIDFFAMEHVRGASLGDVIAAVHGTPAANLTGRDVATVAAARGETKVPDALPELFFGTWVQACCRLASRMARAVQHAHERGVVHRDLKPNNTMVTADGRVLLLDFGLASASGASRITRTGAQLGTLTYMAPEQLAGDEVDARTDVYALGVTLYELLALRSPFAADSDARLRWQIVHGRSAPLREQNGEVPLDVQTIVAVAMERDAARRYATAAAFADDVERFLQHRPIAARPAGALLRARRWSQRHPAWATAIALAVVAALATPFLVRLTRGVADAQIAAAQEQARSGLRSAIAAIEGILTTVRSPTLTRTPGLDAERRRQVGDAVALLDRLERDHRGDAEVQGLFVRGMLGVADFRVAMGEHQVALATLDRVDAVLAAAAAARAPELATVVGRVTALLCRGKVLADLGRLVEAERCWQDAVALGDGVEASRRPPELELPVAKCHGDLGRLAQMRGDFDEAVRHLELRLAGETRLAADGRRFVEPIEGATTLTSLGTALRLRGDADAARRRYDEARAVLRELANAMPTDPEVRRELARVDCAIANLAGDTGDFAAALPLRQQALAAMAKLVAEFPQRTAYRREHGAMLAAAAGERVRAADRELALQYAREAVVSHEALLEQVPDNLEYRSELATHRQQLAAMLFERGEVEESMQLLLRAVDAMDRVVAEAPDDPHYRLVAGGLWQQVLVQRHQAEQWPQARTAYRQAEACYDAALARGSGVPREALRLPQVLLAGAVVEAMCDDPEATVRVLRKLQGLRALPADRLEAIGNDLHVADRDDFRELVRITRAKQAALPK